jgi:signal transduction histidine kinase
VLPDRVIGVLEVGTFRRRAFTPDDLSLLEELAARLALAVERDRLWEGERAARAAAQAAVLQRDEVLAIVAHDLRNPLGRILMSVMLLRKTMPAGSDARPLDVVQRAIQSMDRLIRDLLDVSRLEAGGLPLDRSAVAVDALLADLCEQFGELARSKRVRLEWSAERGLPPVLADRARLAQATSNLLDNAIRLTPAGGAVSLRAASSRDLVEFAVADTGPGIAAEQLPHLFDRFWQGTRERRGSAGLGLTIVKGIVEAHGGRVFVESTLGEGATFRFWIPVAV